MQTNDTVKIASGVCGRAISWSVLEDGDNTILLIEGKGAMDDYRSKGKTPFYEFHERVTKIVVKPGVSNIGDYAFGGFVALSSVELPETIEILGSCAFSSCAALKTIALPEGLRIIGPKAFEKCNSLVSISFPSTLSAIDFKAFKLSDNLRQVNYAGSERQWNKEVRVSESSLGNRAVLDAEFTYEKTTKRYDNITSKLAAIIEKGGDGRLYVVAPDLTVQDFSGKSGDCSLIIFPNGRTMMIDAGAPPCESHMLRFVRKLAIGRLDYFVLSHPHADHIGNAIAIAKYFYEEKGGSVGTYCYMGLEYKTEERALASYLTERGTEMRRELRAGDSFTEGDVRIDILNPFEDDMSPENFSDSSVNNLSLVMKFTYGSSTYLTGGDLYAEREAMLAEKHREALRADVAKTNHHGAYTSNCDTWLDAVDPKILLCECDDIVWTLFSEKLAARNIAFYKVSERGLVAISMGKKADYLAETEF